VVHFVPWADVAQLVEQSIRNRQVIGSSPIVGSRISAKFGAGFLHLDGRFRAKYLGRPLSSVPCPPVPQNASLCRAM
jgi:hypothetical protein